MLVSSMSYSGGTVLLSPVDVLVMTTSSATTRGEFSLGLAEEKATEPLSVAGDSNPEEDLGLVENNPAGDADLRCRSKASWKSEEGLALICERKGLGLGIPPL